MLCVCFLRSSGTISRTGCGLLTAAGSASQKGVGTFQMDKVIYYWNNSEGCDLITTIIEKWHRTC